MSQRGSKRKPRSKESSPASEQPQLPAEEQVPIENNAPSQSDRPSLMQQQNVQTFDKRFLFIPFVLFGVLGILAYAVYGTRQSSAPQTSSLLEQIGELMNYKDEPLRGEENDRINVLFLGIGGEGHEGGMLTDTMMVASIKPSTRRIALLSLPRDLIVKIYDDEKENYWEGRKINYAYALGGVPLVLTKVSEVTGLKLHYYAIVDFEGFRKMIDDVDGIDVEVERSFIGLYGAKDLSLPCPNDSLYHLEDGPYCVITFTRGEQHFDGERALIFARVRKLAPGSPNTDEGSDFARAQRQQKILEGFQKKLLSPSTIVRPGRVTKVLEDIEQYFVSNLRLWEMGRLVELIGKGTNEEIIHKVIDDSPGGLVITKWYAPTGASVVVPTAGDYDYSEIRKLTKNIFEIADEEEPEEKQTFVQVLNGTTVVGLAALTADMLSKNGFEISEIGNAQTSDVQTTLLYDLTSGATESSRTTLQELLPGEFASPDDLDLTDEMFDSTADFIIILGTDATAQDR